MNINKIPYEQTNAFSKLVLDYLQGANELRPFYAFSSDDDGLRQSIAARKATAFNRGPLLAALAMQYQQMHATPQVQANLALLKNPNCFSVTTAHQPNIFTGHLYFIYKILHAIKLAAHCKNLSPENDFVPVYYMGNEDADLEELGAIEIEGKDYKWETKQKGAVGKMKIDEAFVRLIDAIEARLGVEEYGYEVVDEVRKHYTLGATIEQATFGFVNALFGNFGLIVLLPDAKQLKEQFKPIASKELQTGFSAKMLAETLKNFPDHYKVQVEGREINLFYLEENLRERIERVGDGYAVVNTDKKFSPQEIEQALGNHPERISPNVVLRPVYQEVILPDVAFVGGGGELAYWLELKKVFEAAEVFFPLLVLRNSFALVEEKTAQNIEKLSLATEQLFWKEQDLVKMIVEKEARNKLDLNQEKSKLQSLYEEMMHMAENVDPTLLPHFKALQTQALNKLVAAEKKIFRAEKRKHHEQLMQLEAVRHQLFPGGVLQERVDNILIYLSKYGFGFINELLTASNTMEKSFTILKLQNNG